MGYQCDNGSERQSDAAYLVYKDRIGPDRQENDGRQQGRHDDQHRIQQIRECVAPYTYLFDLDLVIYLKIFFQPVDFFQPDKDKNIAENNDLQNDQDILPCVVYP